MELTAFQKTVIPSIISGDVTTLETFVAAHCEHTRVNMTSTLMMDYRNFQPNEPAILIQDKSRVYARIKEFLSLTKRLESTGLINTVTTGDRVAKFEPIVKPSPRQNTYDADYDLTNLLRKNATWEISALPELSEFVKNGYKTADELARQAEADDRKIAQRDTRRIAYISLGITVVVAVLTAIFNWMTYDQNRNVVIKNVSAFPDTQKVLIVNPSAITSLGNPTNAPAVPPAK
jgi:hypothetical protein